MMYSTSIVAALFFLSCPTNTLLVEAQTTGGLDPNYPAGKSYKPGYCNICGADGFMHNPGYTFQNQGNTWSCGYAQNTVQDVSTTQAHTSDWCNKNILVAQMGGCFQHACRGGQDIQAGVATLGDPCNLCDGQSIRTGVMASTGIIGSHECSSLAGYMKTGVTANVCQAAKTKAKSTCCGSSTVSFNTPASVPRPAPAPQPAPAPAPAPTTWWTSVYNTAKSNSNTGKSISSQYTRGRQRTATLRGGLGSTP